MAVVGTSGTTFRGWRIAQLATLLLGVAIVACLVVAPRLGVMLFWNVVIPVAPALLVVATGVWRNICPLATAALLPDKLGLSLGRRLSFPRRTWLNLAGIGALFAIVPLRHDLFNGSGHATALLLVAIATLAVLAGMVFERKSGWCSGLCPIHPVERLYGSQVATTVRNAHCGECIRCVAPCPDSLAAQTVRAVPKSETSAASELLMAGMFPGYVWGWFQVPDAVAGPTWQTLLAAYEYPVLGGLTTAVVYLALTKLVRPANRIKLIRVFAFAAVACYYWYRLPLLFGLTPIENYGVLVDLAGWLPDWSVEVMRGLTTGFFFWWLVLRRPPARSWASRPAYAERQPATSAA